jgi:hypothetical protein
MKITFRFTQDLMAHTHSYYFEIDQDLTNKINAIALEVQAVHNLLSDNDVPFTSEQSGDLSLIDRIKWALCFR